MGQYVHLNVNFDKVTDTQWEDTYYKTLSILNKFPIPLISLRSEEKYGAERYTLSNNFVHNDGNSDEFWDIVGDFISNERAENFRMYRHRNYYTKKKIGERQKTYDILWIDEENLDYPSSSYEGKDIFGDKTQGYPFQLATLAVAILVENMYPGNAYVFGDISKDEAENIITWLQKQTDIKIQIPVIFDGEKLWKRLDKSYENKEHAIKRFKTLFTGSFEEEFQALLNNLDPTIIIKTYAESLAYYSSLNQIGAKRILMPFFNVRQDVKELIDFVNTANSLKAKDDDKFNLKDLLKVLSSLFITIPYKKREPIRLFSISSGRLVNIEETISRIMLNMSGTPKDVNIYISKNELTKLFLKNTGLNKQEIIQVIEDAEKKCYTNIEKCKELIEQAEGLIQKDEEKDTKEREEKESPPKSYIPPQIIDKIPEEEIYFLEQAYLQKRGFASVEKSASNIGKSLKQMIDRITERGEDYFKITDRKKLVKLISEYTRSNGFPLSYIAWNNIDNETDLVKLYYVLALAMVKENELNFWRWRIHLMESPEVWDYLVQRKTIPK